MRWCRRLNGLGRELAVCASGCLGLAAGKREGDGNIGADASDWCGNDEGKIEPLILGDLKKVHGCGV